MNDAQTIRESIWERTHTILLLHKSNPLGIGPVRDAFIKHGRKGINRSIEIGSGCTFDTQQWKLAGDCCSGAGKHESRNADLAPLLQELIALEKSEESPKVVTKKKEGKNMAKASMWETVKSEAAEAAIASATKTAVKSVRNSAVAALEARTDSHLCQELAAVLRTELGVAVMSLTMGMLMHAAPEKFSSNPQMMLLAKNFRQDGLRFVTGEALTMVAESLLAAMAGPLALASAEIAKLEGGAAGALPEGAL